MGHLVVNNPPHQFMPQNEHVDDVEGWANRGCTMLYLIESARAIVSFWHKPQGISLLAGWCDLRTASSLSPKVGLGLFLHCL